jgi:hypothetical protein
MYNFNYTPTALGYKVEGKLYLGVQEQKRLNTTDLDNRLTDGGEAVSLMCQPPFTCRKIPGTHFC